MPPSWQPGQGMPTCRNIAFPPHSLIPIGVPGTVPHTFNYSLYNIPTTLEVRRIGVNGVAKFPALGLFVKYGPHVSLSDGQHLFLLRNQSPYNQNMQISRLIPKVVGWRHDVWNGKWEMFLYMELIPGVTLEQRLRNLTAESDQWKVVSLLQFLRNDLRSIQRDHRIHPRSGISDSLGLSDGRGMRADETILGLFNALGVDASGVFTHGALHPSHIIVSEEGAGPLVLRAVVSWRRAGWYPEFFETCSMRGQASCDEEPRNWLNLYIPEIIKGEIVTKDNVDKYNSMVERILQGLAV